MTDATDGVRSPVQAAPSAVLGEYCTLGYPKETRLGAAMAGDVSPLLTGDPRSLNPLAVPLRSTHLAIHQQIR